MNARARPEAVLWDMDGTLVNSEPYWMAAETALAERHGAVWTHEQGLELVGNDLLTNARIFQRHTGVGGRPEDVVEALQASVLDQLRVSGAPWRPGALELLSLLRSAAIPCALVTMSYAAFAHAVVEWAPDGSFAAVVAGDEVANGKPDPEPYLVAADKLGVDVARCVAIEDSVPGVTSALAAGARTLAVPMFVDVPAMPGLSRVRSLEDVDLDAIERVLAGEDLEKLTGAEMS
ncbi:HAD family hydrolase [Georgenia halophila]|uniref:HAD family hydrolase n=1 Tax=Georgenia halophila TaxID=620889 RepID=A0ABP8L622_9MICO